jgi:hypothetical protein
MRMCGRGVELRTGKKFRQHHNRLFSSHSLPFSWRRCREGVSRGRERREYEWRWRGGGLGPPSLHPRFPPSPLPLIPGPSRRPHSPPRESLLLRAWTESGSPCRRNSTGRLGMLLGKFREEWTACACNSRMTAKWDVRWDDESRRRLSAIVTKHTLRSVDFLLYRRVLLPLLIRFILRPDEAGTARVASLRRKTTSRSS